MKAVRRLMGLVVAGVMVGLCGTTCAKDAVSDLEPCYVVRMLDFARTAEVVKLTQTEWKALECRISQEKKAYAQAVARASKAWYDDDKNKGITFPENALAPRAILSSEPFNSAEKAAERLTKLLAGETNKKDKDDERLRGSHRRMRDYKAEAEKKDRKSRLIERAADLLKVKMDEELGAARG